MKKEIFLSTELIGPLRAIAVHDRFPHIVKILSSQDAESVNIDKNQARALVLFARYLQAKAEVGAIGEDGKVNAPVYEQLTQGLPDKLLSYILSDFPECG